MHLRPSHWRIRTRLAAGALCIVLVLAGMSLFALRLSAEYLEQSYGSSTVALAGFMLADLEKDIRSRIDLLRLTEINRLVVETLRAANAAYDASSDGKLATTQEALWRLPVSGEPSPFMRQFLDNELAQELRRGYLDAFSRKLGYHVFARVVLVDLSGRVVAATSPPKLFRHDAAEWFRQALDQGVYFGNLVQVRPGGTHGFAPGVGLAISRRPKAARTSSTPIRRIQGPSVSARLVGGCSFPTM